MTRRIVFIVGCFLLTLPVAQCQPGIPRASSSAVQPVGVSAGAEIPSARVVLPDGFAVTVELATDDATRTQGLMFRESLAPGRGMLFLFPRSGLYPFWMKNTMIPLDMIWIDGQARVTRVRSNVPPCVSDPCPSYSPEADAIYVLELAAGEAVKHGITEGSGLKISGIEGIEVH